MNKVLRLKKDQRNIDMSLSSINYGPVPTGKFSWIRKIRESLGMTSQQLGKRIATKDGKIGISGNSVVSMEKSEMNKSISLDTLQRAAEALNCRLEYCIVPNEALSKQFDNKLKAKINELHASTQRTMSLEDQHYDVDFSVNSDIAEQLVKGNVLWD